jgi:hypothetical protein
MKIILYFLQGNLKMSFINYICKLNIAHNLKKIKIKGITYGYIKKLVYDLNTYYLKGMIKIDKNKHVFIPIERCEDEVIEKCKNFDIKMNVDKLKEHLLVSKLNHDEEIMKKKTLKEAHIYCVLNNISAQQYGPMLEKYIINKYKYKKNSSSKCVGDCSTETLENIEIKVSLGGSTHTKFNYVQIRISHDISYYIFTAYHLSNNNVEDEGELYIFKVPKEDLKDIIVKYGNYAHGTIKKNGKITIESLNCENNTNEYAIRPIINDDCWNYLMKFRLMSIN